jgi:lactate dehydrogenase-like 2-hydroxyacid dehydrogenase
MRIVFLDRNTVGEDIDVNVFERYGTLDIHSFTKEHEINSRVLDADIIVTNKCNLNGGTLADSKVGLICVTATGTDNVDVGFCSSKGIAVCNIKGYSTESVVQHTFALIFTLSEKMLQYCNYTRDGEYINDSSFRHLKWSFGEISGKNFGIIGLGEIGRRVGEVARCFGCNVYYWSSTDADRSESFTRTDFDTLISKCDIISIHSPLTTRTKALFGKEEFNKMKSTSILINVGRGGIICEEDLTCAVEDGIIGGAAIDVLAKEPMTDDSPYNRILKHPGFIMTPHIAWASVEARRRCISEICLNIDSFLNGEYRNRVDIMP